MSKALRQLLRDKGISNDILKEVEKQNAKSTEQEEMAHRLRAQQLTKEIVLEFMKEMYGEKKPAVAKKKTIIMPD